MKKISVFVAITMLLTVLLPFSAMAQGAQLEINHPSELPKAGEEFEVTVELSGNPGVCAVEFALSYDKDKMECTEVTEGEVLDGAMSATNPSKPDGAFVTAASISPLDGNGVIAYYKFTAKEDIEQFDFKLKKILLCNVDGDAIEYTIAGVPVVEATPIPTVAPTHKPSSSGGGTTVKPSKPDPDEEVTTPETPDEPGDEGFELYETFPDVVGHWAEKFVVSAAEKGLFRGDDNGNFNPDANITRAQFVTVLWRMAGSPKVDAEVPFTDIANEIDEFKSAIAWGYSNGYINGTSDTTFDPAGTLTREAGMKILHYYSGGKSGNETMVSIIYDGTFTDSKDISDWAKQSVYWAVYNKLISGTSDTTISPKDTATRAQLAKILVNYIDSYTDQ